MHNDQVKRIKSKLKRYPSDMQQAIIRKWLSDQYKRSLYLTCKDLLEYTDITWNTHGNIIRALEAPTKRKLICVPRGCFKSSIGCVGYPIWLLLNNPNLRIMIDSEVYENSKNFIREIRGKLESPRITQLFGSFVSNQWAEGSITIAQRTKVLKESSITASGVGAGKTGQHYDCLDGKVKVFTSNGWKEIKDLKPKNKVLAADGKFHSVVAHQKKWSDKPMIGIRATGFSEPSWMTEDHRVLITRNETIQWVEAKDLSIADYVAVPLIQGQTRQVSKVDKVVDRLLLDADVWRLIGYWLAEGCRTVTEPNTIRFSFGKSEQKYVDDIVAIAAKIGVKATYYPTKSSTIICRFVHPSLAGILRRFGSCAKDKYLPPFALNANKNYQRQMVIGYWRGDGHTIGKNYGMVSISKSLLSGFQLVLAGLGISSNIQKSRDAKENVVFNIRGYKYLSKSNDAYQLNTTHPMMPVLLGVNTDIEWPTKPFRSYFTQTYWWVKVADIQSRDGGQDVYDIQVKDCPSFFTSGGVTAHNCIVHDDLNSAKNSQTPEQCQKVIGHYQLNTSILEPHGIMVVIGTRYSALDCIGHILENEVKRKGLLQV